MTTWMTDDLKAKRASAAALYYGAAGEIEQLYETGKIKPKVQGRRVLLRAILVTDGRDLAEGVVTDMRQAIAHEILAFGPGCRKWWEEQGISESDWPRVGQHVFAITAAIDLVSKKDRECRLCTTRIDDVSAVWDP